MSDYSRRKFISRGLAAAAGLSGLVAADRLAAHYGLVPPDSGGVYGPGETLTYGVQRLLTRHSRAREFSRSQISAQPFANEIAPPSAAFMRLQSAGFKEWKLSVDGLVAHPTSLSLADVKRFPVHSQITEVVCEEGWSFVAEWIGTPLSEVLNAAGLLQRARYVVYSSLDRDTWESIDMDDAMHPQTLLTYAMNDGDLPVPFGGPLRLRVPRQLGYKSVKFLTHVTVTDSLKSVGKGLGSAAAEDGYAWYAGI
jgi:DMSO/TMAO reductase YedYZ molybdopterin-dependent catalytic subunit